MSFLSGSDSMFQTLIRCVWNGSLLLAGAWVAALALRRASASLRHLVWASALASLLSLPLAILLLPAWVPPSIHSAASNWLTNSGARFAALQAPVSRISVDAAVSSKSIHGAADIAPLLWLAGFCLITATRLGGVYRVARMMSGSRSSLPRRVMRLWDDLLTHFELGPTVELREALERCMPFAWGLWRPRVVLPAGTEEWSHGQLRSVLAHELAHIRRRDWLAQMAAELCRAVYWFHPLVWFACSELRKESELACDDAAMGSGIESTVYAGHVLDVARSLRVPNGLPLVALAMARHSNLERRFVAMLNSNVDRRAVSSRTAFIITGAVILLVTSVAAMQVPVPGMSGKIFGTVYDPSGGVVPNATVIMANESAKTKDMTTTSAAGVFEFVSLPSGKYTLDVAASGFKRFRKTGVVVEIGQGRIDRIALELGSVFEKIDVVGDAPAASEPAAAAPAAGEAVRVGGSVQNTKLRKMKRPEYPLIARNAGIQGSVLLTGVIGTDGAVQELRVMNTQIDPDLAKSAVEAVSEWVYEPTLLNGKPVDVITEITVNYTLAP